MAATAHLSWKKPSVLPGLGLSLGILLTALSLIVLIPLAALFLKAASAGPADIWAIASSPRTLAALRLSFFGAAFAASVNAVFGLILAWVLVRYDFPGRRLVDAAVDLPFALPTAVAGIALAAIYAPNGWVGGLLVPLGIKVAYTPLGVMVALIFVGLPFVVRTVQPVLQEMQSDVEEAAALLGACEGEYGSVIFIAGNVPMVSEIAPLLIVIKLEQFDYAGAAVVATLMLLLAFILILAVNLIQARARGRFGDV
jgi:sulfate transport system permease protein